MAGQHLERLVALGVAEEDLKTMELLAEVEVTLVAELELISNLPVVEEVHIVNHRVAMLLKQVAEILLAITAMSK